MAASSGWVLPQAKFLNSVQARIKRFKITVGLSRRASISLIG
ncbi:hypothetical protein [Synechococcus sp. PCC 6312]|nr:hypothetical protein [Synechococcus sp. PCC 6312]